MNLTRELDGHELLNLNRDKIQKIFDQKILGYWNIITKEDQTHELNHQIGIRMIIVSKGKILPLHDHPNMTVISKVIKGKLLFQSFDF
jgi:quercetin dioxygenase-like cupin family protein